MFRAAWVTSHRFGIASMSDSPAFSEDAVAVHAHYSIRQRAIASQAQVAGAGQMLDVGRELRLGWECLQYSVISH